MLARLENKCANKEKYIKLKRRAIEMEKQKNVFIWG